MSNDQFEQQWLSGLPEEWAELRADFLCDPIRIMVEPDRFGDDLVAHYSIPHVQETGGPAFESASDIASLKLLVTEPTLLVSKLNPQKSTICIAYPDPVHPTLASSEFVAICSDKFDQRYAYYLWSSEKVRDRLSALTQSATRSHQRVNPSDVTKLPWKWPSIEIQQRIARFLDEKTARIDALIEKKQALLERLAEKRQALITHAVTKGLNPDVPMKTSHAEWLSDIPAHWQVQRLRFSVDKIEQGWSPQCENRPAEAGEWGVLKVGCVNGDKYDESENKALPSDLGPITRYEVRAGDLLVSRANTRELLGSATLVDETQGRILFCDKLYRLEVGDGLDRRYLAAFLRTPLARFHYEREATGTSGSMQNIGQDTLKNLCHPLPPLAEQQSIGQWAGGVTQEFSRVTDTVTQAIETIREHRSALITAAVTGQITELNG